MPRTRGGTAQQTERSPLLGALRPQGRQARTRIPRASVGATAASSGWGVPRACLPENVVGLHATVLVARADHRHPQRRRRHGGDRPVRTLRLRAPTQSRLFRTSKMAAAAPGSHDAKRRRLRRIASGRAAWAHTRRPRGLPADSDTRRRAEEGPPSRRQAAGALRPRAYAAEARSPHRNCPPTCAGVLTSQGGAAVSKSDA